MARVNHTAPAHQECWSLRARDHLDMVARFMPLYQRAPSRDSRRRFVAAFARVAQERAGESTVAAAWMRGLIETLQESGGAELALAFIEAGTATFAPVRRTLANPAYAQWRHVIATWTGEPPRGLSRGG